MNATMSFGRSIAFHPLIDLLRRTFRIEEADEDETIVRKAMAIAADICVYTNRNLTIEKLQA